MALPDTYRAVILDQQRQLAKLVNSAGLGPVRKLYMGMLEEVERKLRRTAEGTFTHVQLRGTLAQIKLGLAGVLRQMTGKVGEAAYKVGLASARSMLHDVASLENHFTGVLMPLPVLETGRLSGIVEGATSSLLSVHKTSMARYGVHLIGRMEMELGAAVASGDSHAQAIDRIMKVGDVEWYRGERIVRTELAYASNASSRAAVTEQAEELDGDLWMRWSEHVSDSGAPLDDRVGVDSEAMNGQVAPPSGEFTQPPSAPDGERVGESLVGKTWQHPPNRPNDRACLAPWRIHWGISGWVWRGRRVPVTQAMVDQINGRHRRRVDESAEPEEAVNPVPDQRPAWVQVSPPPSPAALGASPAEPAEPADVESAIDPIVLPWAPVKNQKRVEAARKAGQAAAERRREIHSAVKSNLPDDLLVAWDKEGHKFLRQQAGRIAGIKDRINAASKISEAFAETYGSGAETAFGNEGDRYFKRAELEAQHAETWASEQERKHYEEMRREAFASGDIDEHGELTDLGRERLEHEKRDLDPPHVIASNTDDEDPPF